MAAFLRAAAARGQHKSNRAAVGAQLCQPRQQLSCVTGALKGCLMTYRNAEERLAVASCTAARTPAGSLERAPKNLHPIACIRSHNEAIKQKPPGAAEPVEQSDKAHRQAELRQAGRQL